MKYDALTLDTNIFTNNGYALEHGLLKQLEQFKKGSVKLLLSEIVIREVLRHVIEENKEIRTNLDKAINRANNKKLLKKETSEQLEKLIQAEPSPEKLAKDRLKEFQKNTGLEIIKADSAEISELVKRYFGYEPPFENNAEKKHEFPDAIALLSLEKHAKEEKLKILAVSKDKGWMKFADSSDYIDVLPDLTEALSVLQTHAEEAQKLVASFLKNLKEEQGSEEYDTIQNIIEQAVSQLDVDVNADSHHRVEATYSPEIHYHDFSFIDRETFSIVQIGKDFVVVEIPVHIDAHASAEFDFYVYDSIDKDEVYMGNTYIQDMEIGFDAAILATLEIESNIESNDDSQTARLTDVELIKTIDSVDFGYIEPHYEPDYEE